MKRILLCLMAVLSTQFSKAQIEISTSETITENFNSIGGEGNAALPANWKVSKSTSVRAVDSYGNAVSVTDRRGGVSLATNAGNGIYNFGAGDAETATDRAIGFLSSTSETKSGNLYSHFKNTGTQDILSISLTYSVKKFRHGSNPNGFAIQAYCSVDGVNWVSMGAAFNTSFSPDADNSGFSNAVNIPVTLVSSGFNLPSRVLPNEEFYLAWSYSVISTSTTSNAQALSIDNVSLTANAVLPVTTTNFTAKPINKSILLNWQTLSEQENKHFEIERSADGELFASVATIAGAGNSNEVKNYAYTDYSPLAGVNYYRLLQQDFNGTTTIVKTVAVNPQLNVNQLSVFVGANGVNVTLNAEKADKANIELYDFNGRKLAEQPVSIQAGINQAVIHADLIPGLYFVKVLSGTEVSAVKFAR